MKSKKNNTPLTQEQYICSICGKLISGEHVYIRTKRRTELRIHFECMETGKKR